VLIRAAEIGSGKTTVHDCAGQSLPGVVSYDTETREAKLLLVSGAGPSGNLRMVLVPMGERADEDSCVVQFEGLLYEYATVTVVLPGSYAMRDGHRLSPSGSLIEPLTLDCDARTVP
jgi:hypothetical protein